MELLQLFDENKIMVDEYVERKNHLNYQIIDALKLYYYLFKMRKENI